MMALLVMMVLANGAFVTVEKDAGGVWWFKHGDTPFLSSGVNHVNNGGQDDGVGARARSALKAATGHDLCGDSLLFDKLNDFFFHSRERCDNVCMQIL